MTKILLIRHGQVEGIAPGRFRGRADLALTERGCREAEAVAREVAGRWSPKVIYTSPLQRCVATASEISKACGVNLEIVESLIDVDYGSLQDGSYDDVRTTEPVLFQAWLTTPHLVRFRNGEALQDVIARSAEALRMMLQRHQNETVVAVSHDGVNRALLMQVLDQPLSCYWRLAQDPCCINEIDVCNGRVRVGCINATSHLSSGV
jgi:phosphoserine phosphatase